MKALRAHVHDGQIVLDEPIELPEGAAVEVLLPEHASHDERDELTAEERAEVEAGAVDFERGDSADARAFAHRLVQK